MKVKYYLRGLGIGMLVTALILTVSGRTNAEMSDEAVRRRAAELGMVEKDKTVLGELGSEKPEAEDAAEHDGSPAEAPESVSGQDTERETSAEDTQETEDVGVETEQVQDLAPEAEDNAVNEPETDLSAEDKAEQELAQEIEERADEVADRAKDVAENSPAGRVVMLEVRRGDSSVSVARRAAEAGLVQSAADFDVFLCRNGYDKRISVGNYEITEGASEKEIADIITKSR